MERFLTRHKDRIVGTITGFDRMLFRGTLRCLSHPRGMGVFLSSQHVLLKDYGQFVQRLSQEICEHAKNFAAEQGRRYQYLPSSSLSKEKLAREFMEKDQVKQGLVCVFAAVEPCRTISVRPNRELKKLELVSQARQCKHLYFYFVDREFGLMHIRLQTWLPFNIQVCVNGRRWLGNKLEQAGIAFTQHDNTFTEIADLERAQQFMEQLMRRDFAAYLNALTKVINPVLRHPTWKLPNGYYWSFQEVEMATDIMFRTPDSLSRLYPSLLQYAMLVCNSTDVLRFLGRRFNSTFKGDVSSNLRHRVEGLRVKHWVEENSIKMYDKAFSVLRIETTINNPHRFKAYRNSTRHGQPCRRWLRLRKGVIAIRRLVQIARAANERYLQALAVVGEPKPSHRVLDPVSQPVRLNQRRFRALQPISPRESRLFEIICQGRFLLHGFRNKDLSEALPAPAELERHRYALRIGRQLQLLRAHGLIFKVPKTHYYRITNKGHEVMATALKFRAADMALLAA
ncbi:MAG TPA: hypothetical protein VIV66_05200 [Pyrinomonadaceae bacterium]